MNPTFKIFCLSIAILLSSLTSLPATAGTHYLYLPLITKIQQLQNGDLEKGPDGTWKESSSNGFPLILTGGDLQGLVPQSGVWAAWLGGELLETSTLSQVILIPENAASLQFYYWIESYELPENCGYDFAYVRFGSTTLKTYNLCETYNTNQWVSEQIDLTDFRGQIGELIFEAVNDDVDHSNFFVDTVSVSPSGQ